MRQAGRQGGRARGQKRVAGQGESQSAGAPACRARHYSPPPRGLPARHLPTQHLATCCAPAEPYNFNDMDKSGDTGPPIQFREYSFLANERTPKSLKARGSAACPACPVLCGAVVLCPALAVSCFALPGPARSCSAPVRPALMQLCQA